VQKLRVDLVKSRRRKKVGVVCIHHHTHRGTGTRDEREDRKLGFGFWGEEKMYGTGKEDQE